MNGSNPTLDEKRREELATWLAGEADRETTERCETAVATDGKIRREVDALRRTWDLLDHLPKPEADGGFTQRTLKLTQHPVRTAPITSRSGPRLWRRR